MWIYNKFLILILKFFLFQILTSLKLFELLPYKYPQNILQSLLPNLPKDYQQLSKQSKFFEAEAAHQAPSRITRSSSEYPTLVTEVRRKK